MCLLIFSTIFVWNISHSKKKWASYDQLYFGFHVKYQSFLSDFNETKIFGTDFLKILRHKISCKSVEWELVVSCWQSDTRDVASSRFSLFYECA